MRDIICPHCAKAFKIDESGYADIVKQVRDSEFNEQLHERLALAEQSKQNAVELAKSQATSDLYRVEAAKDAVIQDLNAKLAAADAARQLALAQALSVVEKERDEAKNKLVRVEYEKQLAEQALKDKYETQLKDREDTIERLKDLKARLSTKMVGETLEQHCETEFNRLRATAFPKAYFEKDNNARSGSKGDYIFRDLAEADTEGQ